MNPGRFLHDYSLEITGSDVVRLSEARGDMPAGTAVSITYLPGNDVDALAVVAAHVRQLGLTPVPHISARRLRSQGELLRFLGRLRDEAAVDRVFVVAGDPPKPLGPYRDALAVIESGVLAEYGIRHVGIAGYPEGHPQIETTILDVAMRAKLAAISAAGQSAEIVSQFAFDGETVLDWLARLRAFGVDAPVRIGLPGPASVQSLLRFAARCGVGASAKVMSKYGVSLGRLMNTATPDALAATLARGVDPALHGSVKAHLYPFGGIAKATAWAAALADFGEDARRDDARPQSSAK